MSLIQQHQDYHDGFFDAMDGEPLFERECSPEYEAGWRAFWLIKEDLRNDDFIGSPGEAHLPADGHGPRYH